MNKGLYIHVPFCRRKCAYCDFYSLSGKDDLIDDYTKAVIRNIKAYGGRYDTVYFGGGTPSLLSGSQIYSILSAADIADGAEISAECNPDSASPEKLHDMKSAGINRLSVGIQSFDDRELKCLSRLHNAAQAEDALKNASKAGFDNISADLMLGIPYQDEKTLEKSIKKLSELPVTHISAYMLKIEEGTPLYNEHELISVCADDDTAADLYEKTAEQLEQNGFMRYEISNFSKKGYECAHNMKYWECKDYLGIGPSAHSCTDGKRFAVPDDINGFIHLPCQETYITDDSPCGEEERLMLGLRLAKGICLSEYKSGSRLLKAAEIFEKNGLVEISDDMIRLTTRGSLVSNDIICRLIENI